MYHLHYTPVMHHLHYMTSQQTWMIPYNICFRFGCLLHTERRWNGWDEFPQLQLKLQQWLFLFEWKIFSQINRSQVDKKKATFVCFKCTSQPACWGLSDWDYSRGTQESLLLTAGSSQQGFLPRSVWMSTTLVNRSSRPTLLIYDHDSAAAAVNSQLHCIYMTCISLCKPHKECCLCNYKSLLVALMRSLK